MNRHRGEISAILGDRSYRLCLTLGALAEMEDAFGATDLPQLLERFSSGRLSSRDLVKVIGAGLRGGGNDLCDTVVETMTTPGGAAGFASIVSELLSVTFGPAGDRETVPDP